MGDRAICGHRPNGQLSDWREQDGCAPSRALERRALIAMRFEKVTTPVDPNERRPHY